MSVLTLADAKLHLNITTDEQDREILNTIDAAEGAIVDRVGPLEPTTVNVSLSARGIVTLPITPVLSLTTLTGPHSAAYDVAGLDLDPDAGVVSPGTGQVFTSGRYAVTYQAGRAACPPQLLQAVKELLKHMWAQQRGTGARPGQATPGAGYLLPNRVTELIEPYVQIGFA